MNLRKIKRLPDWFHFSRPDCHSYLHPHGDFIKQTHTLWVKFKSMYLLGSAVQIKASRTRFRVSQTNSETFQLSIPAAVLRKRWLSLQLRSVLTHKHTDNQTHAAACEAFVLPLQVFPRLPVFYPSVLSLRFLLFTFLSPSLLLLYLSIFSLLSPGSFPFSTLFSSCFESAVDHKTHPSELRLQTPPLLRSRLSDWLIRTDDISLLHRSLPLHLFPRYFAPLPSSLHPSLLVPYPAFHFYWW